MGLRSLGGAFRFDPPGLLLERDASLVWLNVGDFHTATAFHPDNAELPGGDGRLLVEGARGGPGTSPMDALPEAVRDHPPSVDAITGPRGRGWEFHFVAHTTEPDENNFPTHTGWIHLHFSDVEVIEKPDDVAIPYVAN